MTEGDGLVLRSRETLSLACLTAEDGLGDSLEVTYWDQAGERPDGLVLVCPSPDPQWIYVHAGRGLFPAGHEIDQYCGVGTAPGEVIMSAGSYKITFLPEPGVSMLIAGLVMLALLGRITK